MRKDKKDSADILNEIGLVDKKGTLYGIRIVDSKGLSEVVLLTNMPSLNVFVENSHEQKGQVFHCDYTLIG